MPMNACMMFTTLHENTNFSSPSVNHHPLNINESSTQEIQQVALGRQQCLSFDNEFHVALYTQQPHGNHQSIPLYHYTNPLTQIDAPAFTINELKFETKFCKFLTLIFKDLEFDITKTKSVREFIDSYNNALASFQQDKLFENLQQFNFNLDNSTENLNADDIYNVITSFQQIFPYRIAFIDGQHRYYSYTSKDNLNSRADEGRDKDAQSYKYFTDKCSLKLSCFVEDEPVSSQQKYFVAMSSFHMMKQTQLKKTMVDVLYNLLPETFDDSKSFYSWIHSDDDYDPANTTQINNSNVNDEEDKFENEKPTFAHKAPRKPTKDDIKKGYLVGFLPDGKWKRRKTSFAQHHYSLRRYIARTIYETYNCLLKTYKEPIDKFRNDLRKDIESFNSLKDEKKYRDFTKQPLNTEENTPFYIDIAQHHIKKRTNPKFLCQKYQSPASYIPFVKMFDYPAASMSLSDVIEHNAQTVKERGFEFLRFKARDYDNKVLMKGANESQKRALQKDKIWYPMSKGMALMINLRLMALFEERFYNLLRYALHNFNAKDFIDESHRLTSADDRMMDQLPLKSSSIYQNSHLNRRQMFDYQSLGTC